MVLVCWRLTSEAVPFEAGLRIVKAASEVRGGDTDEASWRSSVSAGLEDIEVSTVADAEVDADIVGSV